jgi:dUTP pyrophosphatase
MTLKFQKVREVKSPSRGTSQSAGLDFFVPEDFNKGFDYMLKPRHNINIPSGIRIQADNARSFQYTFNFENKSGVCTKQNLLVGANIIDMDYRGELHLHVFNIGETTQLIRPGHKLVQLVIYPIIIPKLEEVMLIDENTERGNEGFGSTGLT